MKEKNPSDNERDNQAADVELSNVSTGTTTTKRQTYHISVELINKLRGYAYWQRRKISEVVNSALEQFFEDKEIKPHPLQDTSSKKGEPRN